MSRLKIEAIFAKHDSFMSMSPLMRRFSDLMNLVSLFGPETDLPATEVVLREVSF